MVYEPLSDKSQGGRDAPLSMHYACRDSRRMCVRKLALTRLRVRHGQRNRAVSTEQVLAPLKR